MAGIISSIELTTSMMTARTTSRLWNDLQREEAQNHADNVLPLHFEVGAYQRYDYKPRSRKYTKAKFNKYGHRNPNVKAGDLRRIILATASAGVRATPHGWNITARGTSKHKMWAQTKYELEQISPSESQRYAENRSKQFVRRADTPEYQFKKRTVIRKK